MVLTASASFLSFFAGFSLSSTQSSSSRSTATKIHRYFAGELSLGYGFNHSKGYLHNYFNPNVRFSFQPCTVCLRDGCCSTHLLGTSPEGEPTFCNSAVEFGVIFQVGRVKDHGPQMEGQTDRQTWKLK